MSGFSFFSLVRHALQGHRHWPPQWRQAVPKERYKVLIVGGGAHGLATAWSLARDYGIHDVAVVDCGWLGGGNTARNTAIIRSNYLHDGSARLYDAAVRLWPSVSAELNYNVMFSPRGVLTLAHSEQDIRQLRRRVYANVRQGMTAAWLSPAEVQDMCPRLNIGGPRWPVLGASWHPDSGTARHDAVAWGYARAADRMGVDLIENCPVTAIRTRNGAVEGVESGRGFIRADSVLLAAASGSARLAESAGIRLPVISRPLQALVSEPVKPALDQVVMSTTVHLYISQTDKGELVLGSGPDSYPSLVPQGSWPVVERTVAAAVELFPSFSRLRMLRSWAGVVDSTPDASPLLGEAPVGGLYLNCGWGSGGFKATPVAGRLLAGHIARGQPDPLAEPFALSRFAAGALVDEHGAAVVY